MYWQFAGFIFNQLELANNVILFVSCIVKLDVTLASIIAEIICLDTLNNVATPSRNSFFVSLFLYKTFNSSCLMVAI